MTLRQYSSQYMYIYIACINKKSVQNHMETPFSNLLYKTSRIVFHKLPSSIQHPIGVTHKIIVTNYYKMKTWSKCGRYYDAPIRPFEIYYVNPQEIREIPIHIPTGNTFVSDVRGGDWDINTSLLESTPLFKSFESRFKDNIEWEETELYSQIIERIDQNKSWKGYTTIDGVNQRLNYIDNLYQSIAEEGLKPNKVVRDSEDHFDGLQKHESIYWPSDEIVVDVGRNGKLLLRKGYNRVSLSRIAEVNQIPVRIRIRHEQWQQLRDKYINDGQRKKLNIQIYNFHVTTVS